MPVLGLPQHCRRRCSCARSVGSIQSYDDLGCGDLCLIWCDLDAWFWPGYGFSMRRLSRHLLLIGLRAGWGFPYRHRDVPRSYIMTPVQSGTLTRGGYWVLGDALVAVDFSICQMSVQVLPPRRVTTSAPAASPWKETRRHFPCRTEAGC